MNKIHYIRAGDDEYVVQLNSYSYSPGKFDGPPENCCPDESEIDWDILDNETERNVDSVTYDGLSNEDKATIEEKLWKIIEENEVSDFDEPDFDPLEFDID